MNYVLNLKGQLISEGNFGIFKSPKKWTFFVRISALASKMDLINKIKALLGPSINYVISVGGRGVDPKTIYYIKLT